MHSGTAKRWFALAVLLCLLLTSYFLLLFLPLVARAQETLTLTVTPPFFELNVSPGEYWASAVKIVNTNPGDLPVYAVLMDFEAQGEEGRGKFLPIAPQEGAPSLASWITLPAGSEFVVPKGQSQEIPFALRVPQDASPGGHYAAILVGTRPFEGTPGSVVRVSSYVASLFLVRVAGDVSEIGDIREFSTDAQLYFTPNVGFTMRFENNGNVHLRPEGTVLIYNMWGIERGRIELGDVTGNVLPGTLRKFNFAWNGERSIFDFGRYTAIATVTFGNAMRQNVSAETSFWIAPGWEMAGIAGGGALLIFFIVFMVRFYVRRTLSRVVSMMPGLNGASEKNWSPSTPPISVSDTTLDLRAIRKNIGHQGGAPRAKQTFVGRIPFVRKYKWFFVAMIPLLVLLAALFVAYAAQMFRHERTFEVVPESVSAQP
ncbi:MAG: hypothetical protein A2945_00700 [Candidatus Liptonbacteria bacterium RIFCSPLOWO2_01_FULL_52_25]|uniref:DUF916 domain-containing protein n=1 Tax=Candidatus Liptonbacteria bacterium RIFCSPLOWO2_01_FULL_52_25 TaxID=1798650 RepID=A0A1G2CDP3_9BACT|nr:MAG: hypothetical protein A2945_00700 [Candidatus Liptonbacteria bacterium RIFCSPLOWO2_01_FULL_52_25]